MAKKKSSAISFNRFVLLISVAVVAIFGAVQAGTRASSASGFDNFGYNYRARIFQGYADGVDRKMDGMMWGDSFYGKDKLVMKWSKAWDEARFGGEDWTCDAWTDNEWNGQSKDGSGEIWHYKIVWVGSELTASPCWRDGGYPIWGEFEVIMSQGSVANDHFWDAHASRAGYGMHR